MTKLSEYVKVAETAQILGVSQGTVRAWADSGKIPMHKNPANGYRMFRPSDLERFLAKVATKATGKHASFREHKPLDQFDWSFNSRTWESLTDLRE